MYSQSGSALDIQHKTNTPANPQDPLHDYRAYSKDQLLKRYYASMGTLNQKGLRNVTDFAMLASGILPLPKYLK